MPGPTGRLLANLLFRTLALGDVVANRDVLVWLSFALRKGTIVVSTQ